MPNTYFQFKHFIIHQERCGMKLSTDAVILGALACHESAKQILDIGTGTGAIALMLAQRYPDASIQAVELDRDAYMQATDNVSLSPWKDRIQIIYQSFQIYSTNSPNSLDLVVSNPPYFPDHIKSKDQQRNLALHNDSLSFEDLISGVAHVLSPKGVFWVILPERQMQDLEKLAIHRGLYSRKKVIVRNHPEAPVLRVVQAFSFSATVPSETILCIRDKDREYSANYKELLKDFLLDF
jgi:tRNA1Val (adenine37-N6)-methyltransferase